MLVVNCALKQDEVIKVVETIEVEGATPFKFVKKQGLKLYFESGMSDTEKAIALVKKTIKASSFGSVLYFSVVSE
jgi:hypothetical protein